MLEYTIVATNVVHTTIDTRVVSADDEASTSREAIAVAFADYMDNYVMEDNYRGITVTVVENGRAVFIMCEGIVVYSDDKTLTVEELEDEWAGR